MHTLSFLNMQNIKEILIANTAEAFADLLGQSGQSSNRVQQEMDLSQRAQFWGGDNKVIITPEPIPSALLNQNTERMGYKNIRNLWPKYSSIRLCKSILDDPALIKTLIQILRSNKEVKISSYAVTEEYVNLLKFFKKQVLGWNTVNLPSTENPTGLVRFLDSKSGFRKALAVIFPHEKLMLPQGFVCPNRNDVVRAISHFISIKSGFVIKVHNGESGWGIKIMDANDIKRLAKENLHNWVGDLFQSDQIWNFAPYIVEEFISVNKRIGGGFPSGEGHITDDGFIFDYICGQEINQEGSFGGVVLNNKIIPRSIIKSIKVAMERVGKEFYCRGYRGIFDVDFAPSKNGNLYVLESNARITGGTHVFNLMSHLDCDENKYVISNDAFRYNMQPQKPKRLLDLISDFLYPIQSQKRGVLISFISLNRPTMGLVVIGNNKNDAHYLIKKIKDCLDV